MDAATRSYNWYEVYLGPPNASADHAIQVLVEEGKVSANELCNGLTPLDAAMRSHNEATLSYLKSVGGVSSRDLAQQSVSVSAAEEEERDVVDKYTEHVKQAHEKKAADAAEDQKTEL